MTMLTRYDPRLASNARGILLRVVCIMAGYATTLTLPLNQLRTSTRYRHEWKRLANRVLAKREELNKTLCALGTEEAIDLIDTAADKLEKYLQGDIDKLRYAIANNYLRHGIDEAQLHALADTCGIVLAQACILLQDVEQEIRKYTRAKEISRVPLEPLRDALSHLCDVWHGHINIDTAAEQDSSILAGYDIVRSKLRDLDSIFRFFK